MAGKKIIKIENAKKVLPKIELNEKELELKEKLMEIDRKIDSVQNIAALICSENKDTLFGDDVISNVVGLAAITAATDIIGQYFGLDKVTVEDMLF